MSQTSLDRNNLGGLKPGLRVRVHEYANEGPGQCVRKREKG